MEYTDIRGMTLERGDHVAFALTRGGVLATGVVLDLSLRPPSRGVETLPVIRVRLDSNHRETWLPYLQRKFVVLERAAPVEVPLATRVLEAVRNLDRRGIHNPDCGMVRSELGLPWSESHSVYLALEDLHESGELRPAAFPIYAYELTALGRE